jgi:hypothetical protein
MPSICLALFLLVTAAENVEPPPRGRLCIGDSKTSITEATCSDTSASTIAVKVADRERRFFWLSSDARTAYAGVIAPKAESIVLDPKNYSAFDTAIDGDATRGWPVDVTMTLAAGTDPQWQWKLDRDVAKRLRRLYVPRGNYLLTANAEHHRTHRAKVVAGAEPSKLEITFTPLVVMRGVIVDGGDLPIADASIAFPNGTLCATANEQGAFTCEMPERNPGPLVVSHPGYASRQIVSRGERVGNFLDFGRFRLAEGHLLTLNIVQPEPSAVRVSLLLDDMMTSHWQSKLKTASLKEGEETVRFDVAEGKYLVVVEGDGPFERLEVPLTMKNEDAEQEIRIEPFELLGSVRLGDELLPEGTIRILSREREHRVDLPFTGGAFSGTVWQRGVLSALVQGPALSSGEIFKSAELGDDPSRWDIRIEKRMIAGRVFDAATRAPLTTGSIEVIGKSDDGESYYSVPVQSDGSYQILAHTLGTYTLKLDEPGYIPYKAELRITAEDRMRTHDIPLETGVLQAFEVVTPAGVAHARAGVAEDLTELATTFGFRNVTDERGRYEIRGTPGQSRLLYFVPSQGSFAVAHVTLPRTSADARPLQIVVPPPSGPLRVHTVAEDGKPMSAGLLVRYNGEFLPTAIARFIGVMGTGPTGEAVLKRLPAGTYDLWALMGDEDEKQLIASGGSLRQPVRVGLSGGEQAVTVVAPVREAPRQFARGSDTGSRE